MAANIFEDPDFSLKAQSLAPYSGTIFLPVWADVDAWYLSGSSLAQTPLSGVALDTKDGFAQAAGDGASGVWLTQFYDQLVHFPLSGAITPYRMPTSGVLTGGIYNSTETSFYASDSLGQLWVAPSSGTAVTPTFGTLAKFLGTSGTKLYTLLPTVSGLGVLTLSSSAAGTSAVTLPGFADMICLAVSGTNVAVGGSTKVALGSGYTAVAMDPASGIYMTGVQSGTGTLVLYTSQGSGIYTETQTIATTGKPQDVAWAPDDVYAFTSDSTNGLLNVYLNTVGTLSHTQAITIAGATRTAIGPDNLRGLVSQAASNQVTALGFNASTWAVSGTVTGLASAGPIVFTGPLAASVGIASGISNLTSIGNVWSKASSGALPFLPTGLATDPFSTSIYACGSAGGSGYAAIVNGTTLASSAAWTGSADALLYTQGQLAVLDRTSTLIRVFGVVAGSLVAEVASETPPTSGTSMTQSLSAVFIAGSDLYEYQYHAPYELRRSRSGAVGIYNGSTWATCSIGITGVPTAVAWDSNGNVSVATQQNALFTVASSGTLVSGAIIPQYNGQPQSVPLGISSLMYSGSALYASTALIDALLQVR